tara:strand:- start:242 stop:985 length:744 start_codon:yes stop_codon:yes gene_type:complete
MVLDQERGKEYTEWARSSKGADLVLVISAHWETERISLGTAQPGELIYDFYGFPEELYRIQYRAPGAPDARNSLYSFLTDSGHSVDLTDRGWDHGVWTPLYWLFPDASVPVLQISIPACSTAELFSLGQNLARWMQTHNRVWLIGSGGLTHNLRAIDFSGSMPVPEPMQEFQDFIKNCLENQDYDSIQKYREAAPHASINHPSPEHFLPLIVVAGAASEAGMNRPVYVLDGFEFGSLSKVAIDFRPN